jgi:hypothetical protein
VVLDGGREGGLERLVGQVEDAGEQVVPDELATLEGDGAEHALGGVVELLDAGAEHAAQATGERLAGCGARDELLGEERVALGATRDLGGGARVGGRTLDAGDELTDGVVGQRGELDVLEPRDARPHGEGLVEGVATVEVVGAVGHDEADGPGEAAGQQQGDEVTRGVVGPVDVLDDEERVLGVAQRGEQGVDGLGDLARVCGAAGPRRVVRFGTPRKEVAEAGVQVEHALDDLGVAGVDRTDELDERQVRQAAACLADAVPDRREPVGVARLGDELTDEARLADAGVT